MTGFHTETVAKTLEGRLRSRGFDVTGTWRDDSIKSVGIKWDGGGYAIRLDDSPDLDKLEAKMAWRLSQ
jgi:hypothetical protein